MISLKEENTTVFDPLTIFKLLIQIDSPLPAKAKGDYSFSFRPSH